MEKSIIHLRKRKNSSVICLAVLFASVQLAGCRNNKKNNAEGLFPVYTITAQAETNPVPRDSSEDAADDPAIWINFACPDSSRIIGTDKKGGLAVYNLRGREIFYYNTGLMNNADLRYRFPLGPDTIDILAVSNRTDQSVDLFRVDTDGSLESLHIQLKSMLKEEVYGLCMYKSKKTGNFYVFVNGKDGAVEQWELSTRENRIEGRIVRDLKIKTQTEGMVADDETGILFIGEEDRGIWKFEAEPEGSVAGELIAMSGEKDNANIKFDIEGLSIYKLHDNEGYLIASSQGNNSYAVFQRRAPHTYIGSFRITGTEAIDGSEETDGLDVVSYPAGDHFPYGLLVVQDGYNKENGVAAPQNFKIVRWDSVALKFNPPLNF